MFAAPQFEDRDCILVLYVYSENEMLLDIAAIFKNISQGIYFSLTLIKTFVHIFKSTKLLSLFQW